MLVRHAGHRLHHGMARAFLLGLEHPVDVAAREGGAHLVGAVAMDDVDGVGIEGARGRDDMRKERPAGQWLQHLRQVARHALALAGGQDDDGQGHRPNCTEAPRRDVAISDAAAGAFDLPLRAQGCYTVEPGAFNSH